MGYLFTVVIIINTTALIAMGLLFAYVYRELPMYVATAVSDEVRKQDDRIEKRLSRASDAVGNDTGPEPTPIGSMRVGQPYRR